MVTGPLPATIKLYQYFPGMVKLVDTLNLKFSANKVACRFDSGCPDQFEIKDHQRVVFFVANNNNKNMAVIPNTLGTSQIVTSATFSSRDNTASLLDSYRTALAIKKSDNSFIKIQMKVMQQRMNKLTMGLLVQPIKPIEHIDLSLIYGKK